MTQTGDVKFTVDFMPAAEGAKLHDDGEWPGDYMRTAKTTDFRKAEAFAIQKAADDFFGCTSVHKEICENAKYDWWECVGTWEVMPETKPGELDLDAPDTTH